MEAQGSVVARIERLERTNRRLWALLGALAVVVVGLVGQRSVAASGATVMEANRFVLKDGNGTTRGEMTVGPHGGGRLILYGETGETIADIPAVTSFR